MNGKQNYAPLIEALENIYGKPNSSGFGSAVFYEVSKKDLGLTTIALDTYKLFMGDKWNAATEATWLSGWKLVYERSQGKTSDILNELNNIQDADAKRSVPLLTELIDKAEEGKLALAAAFNHPDISHVAVFTVGDNAALSGLVLSGLYKDQSACSVICLMD